MSYDQVAIEPDLQQSIDLLSGPNAIFTKNQIELRGLSIECDPKDVRKHTYTFVRQIDRRAFSNIVQSCFQQRTAKMEGRIVNEPRSL